MEYFMPATKNKKWTYNDYLNLPDDKRYEIIDGELIEMAPSPRKKHQIISLNLSYRLLDFVRKHRLGHIISAPFDVHLNEKNILQPDILFILQEKEDILKEEGVFGSPDLVIEILSPSTTKRDRENKYKIYEKFGIKEYWIVDPDKESIEVYVLEKDQYRLYNQSAKGYTIKSHLFSEIEINYNMLIE